jgi:hypothetical protein
VLIVVVVLVGVWSARPDAPPSMLEPTPVPVILVATAVPAMSIPVVAPSAELRLLRAVVAYDAPDGAVLGAIEPGRAHQLLARSGTVWVRRDELEGVVDVATPHPAESPGRLSALILRPFAPPPRPNLRRIPR